MLLAKNSMIITYFGKKFNKNCTFSETLWGEWPGGLRRCNLNQSR